MPKRSKKSNPGCCLVSLILWPFQLLESLINSLNAPPATGKSVITQPRNKVASRSKPAGNADRFVEVSPIQGQNTDTPSIGFSISYGSSKTNFFKEAQRFRTKEEGQVNHVPFKCYWPTYGDMNGWQQQWYFYWRAQARRNNFLPTDLSYIFVHVYEILNLVETPDPVQAAGRIHALWLHYRRTYPKIDNYLPDWGGDLLAVKSGGTNALAWWENLLEVEGLKIPDPIVNTIVEKALRTNGLDNLPYKIWALLSDYQPRNKFYQKHNVDHYVDLSYEKAIKVANAFYVNTTNKSLIDQFVSNQTRNYEKTAFTSALIGFQYPNVIRLASGRDYAGSSRLANNITSIMKYAENLLRKQLKFSAKLSGIEIHPDLAKQLDAAFRVAVPQPKQPEPIRITLDHERVASLHEESRIVSDMLATSQENAAKELLTDLEEMRLLWKELGNIERLLLAGLLSQEFTNTFQIQKAYELDVEKVGGMLGTINTKALTTLGDKLIYENDDRLTLAEDFLDELEVVVRETPPIRDLSSANDVETIDPWTQLFDKLEPMEVAVVKMLGQSGKLAESEIDQLAREHNAMGNAVMDLLNEKAQESLNHLPFYPEDGLWLVEEDDMPILQQRLGVEVN